MSDKRKEAPTTEGYESAVVKRKRQAADGVNGPSRALTIGSTGSQQKAVIKTVPRTSALRAPIMELSGHTGEIYACRFDGSGHHIASASFDRTIRKFLWLRRIANV